MNETEDLMNRVEQKLNSLSDSLSKLENKIDGQDSAPIEFQTVADENISDLSEFKTTLDKLQSARRELFSYTFAQNQDSKFLTLNEIRRLSEVLTDLNQQTKNFSSQCEQLEKACQNIESSGELQRLLDRLKSFESNLATLGTYTEKINAAALADENFSELRESINTLSERLDSGGNSSAPYQNICDKIADIIYSDETAEVFRRTQNSPLYQSDLAGLNDTSRQRVLTRLEGSRHFFKIYTDIKRVLDQYR